MFYLPLAVLTWLSFRWMIEPQRLPSLLVYGLFGSALATVQDRLVILYQLWEYRDIGPISSHAEIALLISLSAAPIFGMRFVQGLKVGAPIPWRRIIKFTAISMLPEVASLFTGNILYHNWWNIGWSVCAYAPIWLAFWGLHRRLSTPEPAPVKPPLIPGRTTAPGS